MLLQVVVYTKMFARRRTMKLFLLQTEEVFMLLSNSQHISKQINQNKDSLVSVCASWGLLGAISYVGVGL